MNIDLSALSLKELNKLAKDVQKAIVTSEARRLKEARAAMQRVAKEYGVSVDEVVKDGAKTPKPTKAKKSKAKKPAKKLPPKFKNPDDASQTWSGKGRRPAWYVAAQNAGKTDKDLSI